MYNIIKKLLSFLFVGFVYSGCTIGFGDLEPPVIKDYEARSVVYGWLDNSEVDANRLNNIVLYAHIDNCTNKGLCKFNINALKFKNGYIYYGEKLPNGLFSVDSAIGQHCYGSSGWCNNSLIKYGFGEKGPIKTLAIRKPGVYYFGAHKITDKRTIGDLIGRGKFELIPAINAPSQHHLLEAILEDMQSNNASPIMIDRVREKLKK